MCGPLPLIGSPTISTLLSTCHPYLVPPVDIKCTVQEYSPRSVVATLIMQFSVLYTDIKKCSHIFKSLFIFVIKHPNLIFWHG